MNEQQSLLISSRSQLTSALEGLSLRCLALPECGSQVRRKGDFVSPFFLYTHSGVNAPEIKNGPEFRVTDTHAVESLQ